MNMLAPETSKASSLMKTIYYLDTRPGFQAVMDSMKDSYVEVTRENPEAVDGISINTGRIIAAAIQAASDADLTVLAGLIDEENIPNKSFKDKKPHKDANYKTVHLPLMMTDYLKAGAANMNIYVLGPKEDAERLACDKSNTEYRLTARQYLHLAVLYLNTLSKDHQLISLISSNSLYPFVMPGPTKRKKVFKVIDNTGS